MYHIKTNVTLSTTASHCDIFKQTVNGYQPAVNRLAVNGHLPTVNGYQQLLLTTVQASITVTCILGFGTNKIETLYSLKNRSGRR